jgi:hypothetical protein
MAATACVVSAVEALSPKAPRARCGRFCCNSFKRQRKGSTAMTLHPFARRFCASLVAAGIVLSAAALLADSTDSSDTSTKKNSASTDKTAAVDMFAAMKSGDLDVKIIPHDSTKAQIILKNNTDQPLTVKLPDAFVATPILAQQQGGGLGGAGGATGSRSTSSGSSSRQSTGGGMGSTGGGFGSIPPEHMLKFQVPIVCLEYGKADPNPHVPYKIEPADQYTSNGEVQAVCKLLGDGKLDQRAAQAAAWHVANHMSWDELANLQTFPHYPQYSKPYFNQQELREAIVIVDRAIKLADAKKASSSSASASASSASEGGAVGTYSSAAVRN